VRFTKTDLQVAADPTHSSIVVLKSESKPTKMVSTCVCLKSCLLSVSQSAFCLNETRKPASRYVSRVRLRALAAAIKSTRQVRCTSCPADRPFEPLLYSLFLSQRTNPASANLIIAINALGKCLRLTVPMRKHTETRFFRQCSQRYEFEDLTTFMSCMNSARDAGGRPPKLDLIHSLVLTTQGITPISP